MSMRGPPTLPTGHAQSVAGCAPDEVRGTRLLVTDSEQHPPPQKKPQTPINGPSDCTALENRNLKSLFLLLEEKQTRSGTHYYKLLIPQRHIDDNAALE